MSKPTWKPWNKVLGLRDELRSRDLAMNLFAADLYDVVMGKARPVYGEAKEFFAQTYPTYNLRQLAKDVLLRLAGENDKAVRQLELTYGGGKTHTLITLYHLVYDPASLPDLPAVQEFLQHVGRTPPRSRVVVLPFDKLDAETGLEVRSPAGAVRQLKHPWSVLAYQLAGDDGLRLLHAEGQPAERESPPAEPLLVKLLSAPAREGLATLVLIDETLIYVRQKVGLDPVWRARLIDFFQYLTQAATKVSGCAVVASLLASDPRKNDPLSKELAQELYAIFRRQREESVQPVLKEDVAEVLRRRFFRPETVRDREGFRPHVVAALQGLRDFDEQTRKEGRQVEDRYVMSYPFHPELTDVFYSKWTQLESFQRTRGVLRTYALALRDAWQWDTAPLVGVNVFLGKPGETALSEAARELTSTAGMEEYEGKKQEWVAILEGELAKARDLEAQSAGLNHRELEQAVFATFLHSQPIGQDAATRDLHLLLAPTRPDKIELEKALKGWARESWFLDDEGRVEGGEPGLPKKWRLGLRPNLKQMHDDASKKVQGELIESELLKEVRRLKSLTSVPRDAGVRTHLLPERPRDVEDEGDFHYAVLGPKAASTSGSPSAEAKRFLDEKAGPESPRVYRNALVLVVPSRDGLDAVRKRIRDLLGWEEVGTQLAGHEIDSLRRKTLDANRDQARAEVPKALQQAYCIVVTVSEKNEAQAFKLNVTGEPLFAQIKADARSRIQESAIAAEALLPEGPYSLWKPGDTARRVKDLAGAFAQFPHLPKMLRAREVLDTLVQGARDGWFVLRLGRPDHTVQTWWRQAPPEPALGEAGLEVVLPDAAELAELPAGALLPGALPGLWSGDRLTLRELSAYFEGGRVVQVQREGYQEPMTVPKAGRALLEAAVGEAVRGRQLWLLAGQASLFGEAVLPGLLNDEAALLAPPAPVPQADLLPDRLPEAWRGETTTALALFEALVRKSGKPLPWTLVGEALQGALHLRLLERTADSGAWPCDLARAAGVKVRVPAKAPETGPRVPKPDPVIVPAAGPVVPVAQAELSADQLQDFTDQLGELMKLAVGLGLKIQLRLELNGAPPASPETIARANALLAQVAPELQFR